MQNRSSLTSPDLIRGEWLCMCITWGCMLEQEASSRDEEITFVVLWENSETSILRTRCSEDQVSPHSSENLQTCEAPLTHASPDWPAGAWEHFLEARPVNWAAGQRCLLQTGDRRPSAPPHTGTGGKAGRRHAICSLWSSVLWAVPGRGGGRTSRWPLNGLKRRQWLQTHVAVELGDYARMGLLSV